MLEVRLSDETVERVSNAVVTKALAASEMIQVREVEIRRLQRWLGYIAGGFSSPSDAAEQALKGEQPPVGF